MKKPLNLTAFFLLSLSVVLICNGEIQIAALREIYRKEPTIGETKITSKTKRFQPQKVVDSGGAFISFGFYRLSDFSHDSARDLLEAAS